MKGSLVISASRSHAAILLAPTVVSLLGNLQQLADLGDLLTLAKFHVSTPQLLDNLVGPVSLLLHLKESFPGFARMRFSHFRWFISRGGTPLACVSEIRCCQWL
jgi:hypothetical protein